MALHFANDRNESPGPTGWLYRCEDRSPFAFARGDEFIRRADHTRWARLCGAWLLSDRSGARLAYRVGNVFYDAVSGEPLYYQPPLVALAAQRPCGESSAVRAIGGESPHCTVNTRRDQSREDRPETSSRMRGVFGGA